MTNKQKLLSIVSPANIETVEGIRFREENKTWLRESQHIAIKVLSTLRSQGLTQKELAERMQVSPQYINKLVKGKENLTIETISKLQSILHIPLLASYQEKMETKVPTVALPYSQIPYQKISFSEYQLSTKKAVGYDC
jgi:transcriptional regulator with XRE-family HTH domain